MAKTLIPAPHLSLAQVEEQYHSEQEPITLKHLAILRLLLKGRKCPQVADDLGYSVGWVRRFIHKYNDKGTAVISDGRERNGGHSAILSLDQQEELLGVLKNEKPPDLGLWSGPKVAKWITNKTGRKVSRGNTGWDYMVRLGFSLRVLRPKHQQADPILQENFKKNSPRWLTR